MRDPAGRVADGDPSTRTHGVFRKRNTCGRVGARGPKPEHAPLSVQLWLLEYQAMSTLWTPDGERPLGSAADRPLSDADRAEAEALAKEMAEVRAQLAQTPAAVVVANHVMGFYELAAIHLSQQPPSFTEATVAIDAMRAVIEKLPGRLGENEQVLRDALSQLQLAFVQLKEREAAAAAAPDTDPETAETDSDAGSDAHASSDTHASSDSDAGSDADAD